MSQGEAVDVGLIVIVVFIAVIVETLMSSRR